MHKIGWFAAVAAVVAGCFSSQIEKDDVVVETSQYVFVIGADAKAKSLKLKANGEEMLDAREGLPVFAAVQDRPFNNEIKLVFPNKETVFRAKRVRREGEFLIVGFDLVSYEAKIRVTEKSGYALFELVDFILGPRGTASLDMTYPPVSAVRILDLPVRNRANYGEWMNAMWDEDGALAVMAAEPYTWIDDEPRHGFRRMFAEARRGLALVGAKVALVAAPTESFLDGVDAMEKDLGLPRGVESRRSPALKRSTYWTPECTPKNVDEHIAMAKKGGFRQMLLYHTAVCKGARGEPDYGGIGDYELRDEYVNGYDSLREMLAKIKAAGITPGLHVLHTFIGLRTHYVTPVADPRLNITRHFTLAKPLDGAAGGDLFVQENPASCPTNAPSRVLVFGGEIFSYEGYVTERPYRFTGVKRGHFETKVVNHDRGQIGGILDICEYGAKSVYIDQDTDLQDEVAEKIAKVFDCGFEFMYCDGSEGVSEPPTIHVANAQYRVWKKFARKPIFMEGAAKGHFAWHHLSAANAFDVFAPEIFKAMIVRWPQYESPIIRADFSRPDYGWWGVYLPGQDVKVETETSLTRAKSVGTQMDMWEFGTSRAAAWDAPATIQFTLEDMRKHPRLDDLLEVMRRWEDVRAKDWLTSEMKERLKSSTQEHHLYLNEKGEYELCDIEMLPTPEKAKNLRGFVFERNGRRTVAYWHTSGAGTAKLALGAGGATRALAVDKLRYLETGLSKDAVVKAFAAAEMK